MYGRTGNLYVDDGGALEYYIIKTGENEFTAHAFRELENRDGWLHWEMETEVTPEMLDAAVKAYGPEDADFLAAMDEIQQWPPEGEELTGEEKEELVEKIREMG